jgi:hypothetical protein
MEIEQEDAKEDKAGGPEELAKLIGERVKELREGIARQTDAKYSQEQLAQELLVSDGQGGVKQIVQRAQLGHIEAGRKSPQA